MTDCTRTIEILAHTGGNYLAAAEALAETNRQLAQMARADAIAHAWTPIVEALKQVLPAALHPFITTPADREPREEDPEWYGTYVVNPVTLELPGCMAIYAYWSSRDEAFHYRASRWLSVEDEDGVVTLESDLYNAVEEEALDGVEPSLEIAVFQAKQEYERRPALEALAVGRNRLQAQLHAEAEDAAQRKAENSAAALLDRAVNQTTVDREKAKLLTLRAIGLALVDLVEVMRSARVA